MKAALVQCPGWGRECPPFSLACLAAYVRAKGHEAACFDLNHAFYEASPEWRKMWDDKDYYSFWENRGEVGRLIAENEAVVGRFVREILDSGASVIGFTTHTTSFLVSLEIAGRIKKLDPSRVIIFGGPQCSREQCGLPFAGDERVDAVAVGEGEETLVEVLESVGRTGRVEPLPGLILRWEGVVKDCGDRPLIDDLDSLPYPDYSDFKDAILGGRYNNPKRLEIFDSRGCVRTCHFCSEWQFWRRFRSMSGRRMFEEVRRQASLYPGVSHFYFIGSLVNGNMRELERFCDLVIGSGLPVTWEGQAIVQPLMDGRMLKKMAAAGCRWLGFGVESGSEPLRARMNKKFTNANAAMTLRAAAEAGIKAQINIMFGMPTETREDFEQTMSFLREVRPWLDTVLASQSFCVIDKNTIFHREPERFGIKGQEHHLFWDSDGGRNDYPERFRRYEEFCRLALELGLPETSGVLRTKPDKWLLLGSYHEYKGDFMKAAICLRRSLRHESVNKAVVEALARCTEAMGRVGRARAYLELALKLAPAGEDEPCNREIRRRLEALPALNGDSERVWAEVRREGWARNLAPPPAPTPLPMAPETTGSRPSAPAPSPRFALRDVNVPLNDREFAERKERLFSTPKFVTLGTHNACNAKCVFCLEGRYSRFSLDLYKEFFEARMGHFIRGAQKVTFTGFGEILWVPGIEEFLDYINETLPDTEKIFTTNGTPLKPSVVERLLKGRYSIQISLHASNGPLHQELTLLEGQFDDVVSKIRTLAELRDRHGRGHALHLELVNILTNQNLHDLVPFLRLAWDLRVQGVRCSYVTMFAPDHIRMSPFFEPERANKEVLRGQGAVEVLRGLDPDRPFDVRLPPLFGSSSTQPPQTCYDPWQHIYVELQGSVIPCCLWGDHIGDLKKGDDLDRVWNSPFYKELRRGMASGDPHPWCKNCVRYAGFNVDSVFCHITNRPEAQKLVLGEVLSRGLPLGPEDRAAAARLLEGPRRQRRRMTEPRRGNPASTVVQEAR